MPDIMKRSSLAHQIDKIVRKDSQVIEILFDANFCEELPVMTWFPFTFLFMHSLFSGYGNCRK